MKLLPAFTRASTLAALLTLVIIISAPAQSAPAEPPPAGVGDPAEVPDPLEEPPVEPGGTGAGVSVTAAVGVLAGPITNASNGHVYYLLDRANWTDSEAQAQALGGHLTTINNAAEGTWVYSTFSSFGGTGRALWIGLSDAVQEGLFVWADGDTSTYRNWSPGEPNIFNSGQDYANIFPPGDSRAGSWDDQNNVTNLPDLAATPAHGVVEVIPVPTCAPLPAGAISWWRGENNGTDFTSANPGLVQSGVSFAPGKVGQAFALDGTANSYIEIATTNGLNFSGSTPMSVEFWAYRTGIASISGNLHFLGKRAPGCGSFQYQVASDPTTGGVQFGASGGSAGTGVAMPLGTWVHVAGTYDGTTFRIYTNGVLGGSFTGSLGSQNDARLRLGNSSGECEPFVGLLDEVAMYNRALTGAEVQAIYGADSAGKCATILAPFITQQPQSQSVLAGLDASFSVTANGTAPLAYQWFFGAAPLGGQTNATLNLANVQPANAGGYSVVVANTSGSVTSQVATLSVTLPPARVQVTSVAANALGPVSVPVVLAANGNEAAVGFSLEFNPALLTYTGVTLGGGAPGGSLLVNASQSASGRVGIAVSLPSGTFASGTQQVATVNFTIAPVAANTVTAITLSDSPIVREVANSLGQPLTAEFLSGAVSIVAVDYEGDVTPRPTGNRSLTVSDWVQVGRFVAGLDTPATGGEFQRADTAPRATRGNGNLSATDWVQAGRYAAGLDPITAAGGPTGGGGSAVSAGKAASSGGTREFRVTNTNLTAGRTGTVDIELNAAGDESAATFSLTYDAAQMSFTGATLGTGAAGGTLNVNTSQAGAGRVGLAVSLPIGSTLATGPQQVVRASFLLLQTASGDSPLAFGSTPVLQEVSDPLANALTAGYSDALLKIDGPIPTLTISQNGAAVVLTWPSDIAGYAVEESPTMLVPAAWNAVAAPPSVIGSSNVVVLPATNEVRFFRLRK